MSHGSGKYPRTDAPRSSVRPGSPPCDFPDCDRPAVFLATLGAPESRRLACVRHHDTVLAVVGREGNDWVRQHATYSEALDDFYARSGQLPEEPPTVRNLKG